MKRLFVVVMLLAGLSVGVVELSAHHGRGNVYDMETPITLNGKVTEVAWRNPHVLVYMDVENESGDVVKWAFENSSVNTLAEQGYQRNTLRPGQEITAIVNPSRAGAPTGIVLAVILEDGTEIMSRRRGENPID